MYSDYGFHSTNYSKTSYPKNLYSSFYLPLEYIQTSKNKNKTNVIKQQQQKKKQMRKGRNKGTKKKSQRKSIINTYRQRDTHVHIQKSDRNIIPETIKYM